jgi:hypothetical protein
VPPWVVLAIVAFAVVEPVVIIWGVVRVAWGGFAGRFPQVEPEPDAVRKNFQSFRIGVMNLGYSVHVAVDAKCLHLTPARFLRWFGARPASVPWEQIEPSGKHRGRYMDVRIGAQRVTGPSWALEIAEVEAGEEA